jgi:hypothetical protein
MRSVLVIARIEVEETRANSKVFGATNQFGCLSDDLICLALKFSVEVLK